MSQQVDNKQCFPYCITLFKNMFSVIGLLPCTGNQANYNILNILQLLCCNTSSKNVFHKIYSQKQLIATLITSPCWTSLYYFPNFSLPTRILTKGLRKFHCLQGSFLNRDSTSLSEYHQKFLGGYELVFAANFPQSLWFFSRVPEF